MSTGPTLPPWPILLPPEQSDSVRLRKIWARFGVFEQGFLLPTLVSAWGSFSASIWSVVRSTPMSLAAET